MVKLTKIKVQNAIRKYQGNITIIAESLNVARSTIYDFVEKHNELKQLITDYRMARVDKAESVVDACLEKNDFGAAKYILSTLGRSLGYVEKSEVEVSGGVANVNFSIDAKEDLVKVKEHMSEVLGRKIK